MIGTAAIPITALSAKLISINKNNSPTRSHASFGVAAWGVVVAPRNRTAVSRIPGLADREAWTLIGNSVQVRGTHPYPYYGTNGYQSKIGHETVRHPRPALRRSSYARAHPPGCVPGVHRRRLRRHQHARNRPARQNLETRPLCEFRQQA